MHQRSLFYLCTLVLMASCSKNKINPNNLPTDTGENRVTRYELGSVQIYNVTQSTDSSGNEIDLIVDSARFDLKEQHDGNILAINTFWDGFGNVSQQIVGEYEYGPDGWITSVISAQTQKPLFETYADENGNAYEFIDYETGLKGKFPNPSDGNVNFFSAEVRADTTIDFDNSLQHVEVFSDSSQYKYANGALSQFETYYLRTDSFATDYEAAGIQGAGNETKPTTAWKNYLNPIKTGQDQRTQLKSDDPVLIKTVFLTATESNVPNPLFQLLAPLNFEVMEMPFLHTRFFPAMITINEVAGNSIQQFEYENDMQGRPVEVTELQFRNGGERDISRIIKFNYKK